LDNCRVCHNPRESHHQDKDGVWWCCDNISVRASFKIKSNLYQKQEVVLNKPRPIGFNNKPIPNGMLYSDYTPEQVEAACNAPDFEEKCKHAQENSDKMLSLMMIESDRKIDAINRIAQFEEDAGLYDKVLLSSQRKKYNIPTGMLEAAVSAIPEEGRIFLSGCPGWPGMNACLEAAMCWIDDELEKMELCSIDYKNLHQKFFTLKGREK